MGDTYTAVLDWLYSLEALRGVDLKLERVRAALRVLGDPQTSFRSLHVAGTNGKGSVAAMLHATLSAQGYVSGLYTSPHLVDLGERVRIGKQAISRATLVSLVQEIRESLEAADIELTFFEFMTVLAFVYFARQRVHVAVVEVGLGGRLDATNVIDPVASVISTVDLDHEEFLGHTLASVAAEKAGIIKAGRPVVIGKMAREARQVVAATAAAAGAPLYESGREFTVHSARDGQFSFSGFGPPIEGLRLSLRGRYQIENAGLAVACLRAVDATLPVSESAVRQGLEQVRWPGRLEVLGTSPLIVVDVAHNPAGTRNLVAELPAITGGRQVRLLFGAMRDKRWRQMVELLAPHVAETITTTVTPPRGETAERLAREFARFGPARAIDEPRQACAAILSATAQDEALLVTGSIFLVGAVYESCRASVPAAEVAGPAEVIGGPVVRG